MSNTTRWILNEDDNSTIEQAVGRIISRNGDVFFENNNEDRAKFKNVVVQSENQGTVHLGGKEVAYHSISIKYDKVQPAKDENEDESSRTSFDLNNFIVIYQFNNQIYFIIDRNTGAASFLKTLLANTKRGAVLQVKNRVTSDLIIWLISKVYAQDAEYDNQKTLSIDTITGFKGDTEDRLSTITASGDTVMNILSTLSFLLETKSLRMIKLELDYSEHLNIELRIATNNTVNIGLENYIGNLIGTSGFVEKLNLLVYIEVIPTIVEWYNSAIADDSDAAWGTEQSKKFLELVGRDLSEKVQNKIDSLKGSSVHSETL